VVEIDWIASWVNGQIGGRYGGDVVLRESAKQLKDFVWQLLSQVVVFARIVDDIKQAWLLKRLAYNDDACVARYRRFLAQFPGKVKS